MFNNCDSVEDESRKFENKDDKWFKTPNDVQAKETTRPRFRVGNEASIREQMGIDCE